LPRFAHEDSIASMDWSPNTQKLSGKMDYWSESVDTADAKKAKGANIRIPRTPSTTGSEA